MTHFLEIALRNAARGFRVMPIKGKNAFLLDWPGRCNQRGAPDPRMGRKIFLTTTSASQAARTSQSWTLTA